MRKFLGISLIFFLLSSVFITFLYVQAQKYNSYEDRRCMKARPYVQIFGLVISSPSCKIEGKK